MSVVHAQRSCVFLPLKEAGYADRPQPRIIPLDKHVIQQPQTLGTSRWNFPNINISQALFADQNETSVAVNPTDPLNIIVGANDYRSLNTLWYFSSTDGGYSWKSGELPTNQALYYATDPSVGFGPDGVAFYGNGRLEAAGDPYPINDVVSYRSTTKGQSWNEAVRVFLDSVGSASVTKLADKYYLAVAPTAAGPLPPRVYMTWAEYENGRSRIVLSRSADGGATWSKPVAISQPGKFQAPVPAVASGGEVYVVFIDLDTTRREILFARSTDGGVTFSTPARIASYRNLGPMYPPGSPYPHPIIKGHLRVNSFPSIAIDHSFRHFNRIYVTWAGKAPDGRHHIYLSKSDDNGSAWSEAVAVETDTSAMATDKFFPWVAVDPTTGIVGVCFYDSRMDAPANQLTDLFLGLSEDGGEHFSVRRISDQSFNPSVAASTDSLLPSGDTLAFFGDYNGLTAYGGMWYPAWTDSRVGYDQDIYLGIVNPDKPEAVEALEVQEDTVSHVPILTWEHSGLTVFGKTLTDYIFRIHRSDGATVDLPASSRSFRDSSVAPAATYYYEVTAVVLDLASIAQEVRYTPRAVRKPVPPVVITSRAEADGFFIRFRIPDKNIAGDTVRDLHYLYYIIDGVTVDSFKLSDGLRGSALERSFNATVGYHSVQLSASTFTDGEFVVSEMSQPLWLYAGTPRDAYSETFESSRDIFSVDGWDTTSVDLSSTFLNDSLPNVPYKAGVNSWFLLPAVRLSNDIHTLEFDHIALIAPGDSGLVEVSFDNGVSYQFVRRYDRSNEPIKWASDLKGSVSASDSIPLKWYIGQDAILRFRLAGTNAANEDGWFIDNIRFTNKLLRRESVESMQHSLRVRSLGSDIQRIELVLPEAAFTTVYASDILGRTMLRILDRKYVPPGNYAIEFAAPTAGVYLITAMIEQPGKPKVLLHERYSVPY